MYTVTLNLRVTLLSEIRGRKVMRYFFAVKLVSLLTGNIWNGQFIAIEVYVLLVIRIFYYPIELGKGLEIEEFPC